MAKLYSDEPPVKWICFGCAEFYKSRVHSPCILTVHVAGDPIGCLWPSPQRKVKWEKCNE